MTWTTGFVVAEIRRRRHQYPELLQQRVRPVAERRFEHLQARRAALTLSGRRHPSDSSVFAGHGRAHARRPHGLRRGVRAVRRRPSFETGRRRADAGRVDRRVRRGQCDDARDFNGDGAIDCALAVGAVLRLRLGNQFGHPTFGGSAPIPVSVNAVTVNAALLRSVDVTGAACRRSSSTEAPTGSCPPLTSGCVLMRRGRRARSCLSPSPSMGRRCRPSGTSTRISTSKSFSSMRRSDLRRPETGRIHANDAHRRFA